MREPSESHILLVLHKNVHNRKGFHAILGRHFLYSIHWDLKVRIFTERLLVACQ